MAHSIVMIEIKLRTMDLGTHEMLISNQTRVRNLKVEITRLLGIPTEQQRLLYLGRTLRDDQLICSYNIQNGDVLHLVRTIPGMSSIGNSSIRPVTYSSSNSGVSHSSGIIYGISPGIQREIPHATETFLSGYLDRIRRELDFNRTSMTQMLGFSPSHGILEVEQLARLLSFNRHVLINQTSQLFLDFERDLLRNLNVDDLRMRSTTMHTIQTMFEYVGRHFLELGRVMRQVPMRQHSPTSPPQTGSDLFNDDDMPEFFFPWEQPSVTIRQQNNTGLTNIHGTPSTVTENMGTSVSSGPSTVENRRVHESSIEPSDENNGDFSSTR